jgi:hypothetical protein
VVFAGDEPHASRLLEPHCPLPADASILTEGISSFGACGGVGASAT